MKDDRTHPTLRKCLGRNKRRNLDLTRTVNRRKDGSTLLRKNEMGNRYTKTRKTMQYKTWLKTIESVKTRKNIRNNTSVKTVLRKFLSSL